MRYLFVGALAALVVLGVASAQPQAPCSEYNIPYGSGVVAGGQELLEGGSAWADPYATIAILNNTTIILTGTASLTQSVVFTGSVVRLFADSDVPFMLFLCPSGAVPLKYRVALPDVQT